MNDIYIVVEKKFSSKVEKYLKDYFKPNDKSDIQLVILLDEDESANAIKLMKDIIKRDFIVMQGDCFTDASLSKLLDSHNMNLSSITMLLKEQDLSQKTKGA